MGVTVRDLLLLLAMCLVLYCTGLDTHGVTNWQEAQRVVVSREMQRLAAGGDPDAWIVPRHNGQPYIAKPPMIYWATVGLARLRGGEVELFDLRLAVALAGTLGVLGTYLAARAMLRPLAGEEMGGARHVAGARWAAVFLATGVLAFRSARIGELDIFLVPSVVGAIGCIWSARRFQLERRRAARGVVDFFGFRAHWGWVLGAAGCAGVAALTKGPPALMVIVLGGYGSILWSIAAEREMTRGVRVAGVMAGLAFAGVGATRMTGAGDVLGVLIMGVLGWMLGVGAARLAASESVRRVWGALAHTHPIVVIGAAVLAFWWWGSEVSARIGAEHAVALAREQAENDLNLFMPASPVRNLEALVYGCGVGSVVMLLALAWWVRERPRFWRGMSGVMAPVAWVVLSYAALSLFGKGVARYLTPVWPGVAIVAGAWLTRRPLPTERHAAASGRGGLLLGGACVVLGVGQAWWYASGRETFEHERSPRALMEAVRERVPRGMRYASFEFYTPALDYYAGAYVQPVVTAQMGREVAGGAAWTVEELAQRVRAGGPMVVLCREWSLDAAMPSPVERMRAAGLRVEEVATRVPEEVFRIDNARTVVRPVLVR